MRRLLGPTILVLALLRAQDASATAVLRRDFPDLVARSEQIVIGTVLKVVEDRDANGVARTLVTVGDLSLLKGEVSGADLTLDFAGGRSGTVASRVLDLPVFREGERSVLFIAGNGKAICPLVGVWQGRFRVEFDAARGTETILANDGSPVTGVAQGQLKFMPRSERHKALTLDRFRELIADEIVHPTVQP